MTHDTTLDVGGFSTQFQVSGGMTGAAIAPANGNGRSIEGSSNGNGRPQMTNQLRMLRADQSWSQAELARLLGVSRQTVNALERGKYHPSLPLAFRIAYLFERPIEDVFHPQWERGRNGD
jgi:putative transcriptional regulator